ncbi:MAG TPA: class I SAM-dependent methyltransferase [Firmicutes bacterium]|nr:class I SAM-dependent methyltransferase [Bacillota bacterium]
MDNIYSYPQYYEIAYSYRNIPAEVAVMEEAIRKFSLIDVKHCLELACGNSPHMPELLSRGYAYSGLDLSETMLGYAEEKAGDAPVRFYLADLVDFQVEQPVDFAYIMMGSLYVQDTAGLLSHFKSMEKALKPGGLYFLDWCVDFTSLDYTEDSWVMRSGNISVTTDYSTRPFNAAKQLYRERILFSVKDGSKRKRLAHDGLRRAIFPQEFLLAATKLHRFEFLGWWDDWNWQRPLEEVKGDIYRPITVLRRL